MFRAPRAHTHTHDSYEQNEKLGNTLEGASRNHVPAAGNDAPLKFIYLPAAGGNKLMFIGVLVSELKNLLCFFFLWVVFNGRATYLLRLKSEKYNQQLKSHVQNFCAF